MYLEFLTLYMKKVGCFLIFFFLYSCEHGYACAIVAENSFFPWLLFLLLNGFCYNLTDLRLDFFKVM